MFSHSSHISAFFAPRSIAVVGASPDEAKIGGIIFKNIMFGAARGNIYPVNPNECAIRGIKCFGSVSEIPVSCDLVIIAVRASCVLSALKECVLKKTKAVIVISAGFKETGIEGKIREIELKEAVKGSQTRLLGPNCMGTYDTHSGLNTLFIPESKFTAPKKGRLSVISQSGAVGTAILEYLASHSAGISKFVSYGNRADLDESEILKYLLADRNTDAVLCYIEGLKDGRAFYNAIKAAMQSRSASVKKPVIVLKAGKYAGSSKAALSHTGSMTGDYAVFAAAMRQAGAIPAKTIEDLADLGKAAACFKPRFRAEKPKIAVISNGGGFGVMCADMCLGNGMELAQFSKYTVEGIKKAMPDFAEINNPLDLIGDATKERFEAAIRAVQNDENVDAIAVYLWPLGISLGNGIADVLINARKRASKPLVAGMFGGAHTYSIAEKLERGKIPVYATPRRAMKAIKFLVGLWQ